MIEFIFHDHHCTGRLDVDIAPRCQELRETRDLGASYPITPTTVHKKL